MSARDAAGNVGDARSVRFSIRRAVVAAGPRIDGFVPASGRAGDRVTINGMGFGTATSVRFGNRAAQFSVSSDGQVQALVPAGAVTDRIQVVAPNGTAVSATAFVVTAPTAAPVIQALDPSAGPVGTRC